MHMRRAPTAGGSSTRCGQAGKRGSWRVCRWWVAAGTGVAARGPVAASAAAEGAEELAGSPGY